MYAKCKYEQNLDVDNLFLVHRDFCLNIASYCPPPPTPIIFDKTSARFVEKPFKTFAHASRHQPLILKIPHKPLCSSPNKALSIKTPL